MKIYSSVVVCTFFAALVLSAACTVTINGVTFDSDAGSESGADASSLKDGAIAVLDAGVTYSTCAECGSARCSTETSTCNRVPQGEQNSPCKNYEACKVTCTGTAAEKASCVQVCKDGYPEAVALRSCLDSKCTILCAQ